MSAARWSMPRLAALVAVALLPPSSCTCSTTARKGLPELLTVQRVDLRRYSGTWYEIASFPQFFSRGCSDTTATYSVLRTGEVEVVNRCRKDGVMNEIRGRAEVVDPATNAKLKVSFFGPVRGDYWVIDLPEDYSYAVVGHPTRDYLWILARSPSLPRATVESIRKKVAGLGYNPARLQDTPQSGAAPPE